MSTNVWYCGSFPYRIVNGSPDPVNGFSCNMPYEDAKYCWWRVKNWSVSTDISSVTGTDTFTMPNGAASNANYPFYQTETDLARTFNTAQQFNNLSLARENYSFSHGGFIINSSGSYYPQFVFSGNCGDIHISQDPTGATSSFTGTFNGSAVTLYVSDNGADSYNATFFAIFPIEWWPHAARADGTPIWNAATGANLQDPTN